MKPLAPIKVKLYYPHKVTETSVKPNVIYGPLAVHRTITNTGEGTGYSITHIASGNCIGSGNYRLNVAKAVAKALQHYPEWAELPADYISREAGSRHPALDALWPRVKAAFDKHLRAQVRT